MSAVQVSNVAKPLWPDGFTKGEAVAYYEAIAPALLPHLAGRPVTLRRFPDGVEGIEWYQSSGRAVIRRGCAAPTWVASTSA